MIMRAALGDAVGWLTRRFRSADAATWRYGAYHQRSMPHPFGQEERLRSIVNVGPIELGGSKLIEGKKAKAA